MPSGQRKYLPLKNFKSQDIFRRSKITDNSSNENRVELNLFFTTLALFKNQIFTMKKITLFLSALIISSAGFSQASLLANYTFTGASPNDVSGNGNHGNFVGSPNATADRFGGVNNAISFNNPGDTMLTSFAGVSGQAGRTISFWSNVSFGQAGGMIFSYGDVAFGGGFKGIFELSGENRISADLSDLRREYSDTITDGVWHMWTFIYNPNVSAYLSGVSIYKDGKLMGTILPDYDPGHPVNTGTTMPLKVGGGQYVIDDFKMFSGVLTKFQMDSLYVAEAPPAACLISKFDFNGNATDGYGTNHATTTNAGLTTDRYGYANSAYSFNGSTDYIDIPGISLAGTDFSIGFWAKRGSIDASWHVVMSQGDGNTGSGFHTGFTGTLGNPQNFGFDFMFDGIYAPGGAADSTNWNQWYVTFNNTFKSVTIYLNGQLHYSGATSSGFTGTGDLRLGMAAWGGNAFNGKLDEVKIFSCELNSTQVDSIYQLEAPVPCSSLSVNTPVDNASCNGGTNGVGYALVIDGNAPYTYSWSPSGATTLNATGLSAGTHSVTVTDNLGCTASYTVFINEPSAVFVSPAGLTQPFCFGNCTGMANYFAGGGVGSYTYLYSPSGETTTSATGLCAGTYTFTATDGNGCSASDIFVMTGPPAITNTFTEYNPTCNGMCDGGLTANPSGGAGGYTFLWGSASQSPSEFGLCTGTYTVDITDANGCMETFSTLLTEPGILTVTASATDVTCYDAYDGSVTATTTGGTAPFSFYWTCGYGQTITGLGASPQEVITVYDVNGCTATDTTLVNEPPQIILTLSITPSSCGNSAGSISTAVSGGIGPFQYYWNTAETTQNISALPAGEYFIQLTDATGCYASELGIVNDSDGPSISVNSVTDVTCNGTQNGAIDISISGGAAPYSVMWSNGLATEDLSSLNGGYYDVIVNDNSGCTASLIVYVDEPSDVLPVGSYISPSACGVADGQAGVVVSGGTNPYFYQWDSNAGSQTNDWATNVSAGMYKVVVTDNHGCMDSVFVAVSDGSGPTLVVDSIHDAGCTLNGGDGGIYISAAGSGTLNYLWTNGASVEDMENIPSGIYGVKVTDGNGCTMSETQYLSGLKPGTAQICMLTVDTATNQNVIVWNDTVQGIAQYEIFRETSVAGNYNLISTIQAGTGNTFIDTVANPENKPWRYEIKTTDSCGRTSVYSLAHKTIHLNVLPGSGSFDLSWDQYQGQGIAFTHYRILRYHSSTGWVVIDSVPAGAPLVYSDFTSPNALDTNYYFIEINSSESCNGTLRLNPGGPEVLAAITKSRSNIQNNKLNTTSVEEKESSGLIVFPNPSKDEFTIRFEKGGKYLVKAFDARGRLQLQETTVSAAHGNYTVKSGDWAPGVYFVQIAFPDNKIKNYKLIKQ
jgi:hypothetical protein